MDNLVLEIEETLEILMPKIKKELYQTKLENRKDLEQEIILMIIQTVKRKTFKNPPDFKRLLKEEKIII